jgi:hypothetical protein
MRMAQENERLKKELKAMSDMVAAAERKRTEMAERAERARERRTKQKSKRVEAEGPQAEDDGVEEQIN